MTIEMKSVVAGMEDTEVLQQALLDGAEAEATAEHDAQAAEQLFEQHEGLEQLAFVISSNTQPKATDLALMQIATEMLAIGTDFNLSQVNASFENYQGAQPSLEGIGDLMKAVVKKIVNILKKMWYNFLKLFGSIEAECKLKILKLKELREKLEGRKDTDVELDIDKLSQLVTNGRAKSFGDIAKATQGMYQTFTDGVDNYATFCSKYARMSYLGWQTKGALKQRLIETTNGAANAIKESAKLLPRKAPHDDSMNATGTSFDTYMGINLNELIERSSAVDTSDDKAYKQLADINRSVYAKSYKDTANYQESTPIKLPAVRELTSLINSLIVFYNDWLRMFKTKLRPFADVMDNWLHSIEQYDWIKLGDLPSGGAIRSAAEFVVPDLGRLNKYAYSALNLFYPFHTFCKNNLAGLSVVYKELDRMVGKYEK